MVTKIKNRVNKKLGHFICGGLSDLGCGCEVYLGTIIHGYVYCLKCAEKIKGIRDENGILKG